MVYVYMAPPAYLLIGCLLMLLTNELLDGVVTRTEFIGGMVCWPLFLVYFFQAMLDDLARWVEREIERRRRG